MSLPMTEAPHRKAQGIEQRADSDVLLEMWHAQMGAVAALEPALPELGQAARILADCIADGGKIIYAAAGSSGLMAFADAAELSGTFGISPDRIRVLMAGGIPVGAQMSGDAEDDVLTAQQVSAIIAPGDAVIAVSASGSTPYTVAIARAAQNLGAAVISITNNPKTPLLELANVPICLLTPAEVISGSTRMGAGTAQKAALNLMSALMGMRLGHVFDGMMVNLIADNKKLRNRAKRIVARISDTSEEKAANFLRRTDGDVKHAILVAAGASPGEAVDIIADCKGNLRIALARVENR